MGSSRLEKWRGAKGKGEGTRRQLTRRERKADRHSLCLGRFFLLCIAGCLVPGSPKVKGQSGGETEPPEAAPGHFPSPRFAQLGTFTPKPLL